MAVLALEALHRGLAVDHRGDDVAVLGDRLAADGDPVAVADGGLDHGVAGDFEHEQLPVADELAREREDVLDRLFGEDRSAGRDSADERDIGGRRAAGGALRHRADDVHSAYLVGARTVRVAAEESLAFEGHQLMGHRGGAGEADRLADLPHARRISAPLDGIADHLDDAALPFGQPGLVGADSRWPPGQGTGRSLVREGFQCGVFNSAQRKSRGVRSGGARDLPRDQPGCGIPEVFPAAMVGAAMVGAVVRTVLGAFLHRDGATFCAGHGGPSRWTFSLE